MLLITSDKGKLKTSIYGFPYKIVIGNACVV